MASAAIRTCGGSSRPPSRTSTGSCCSTTSAPASRTSSAYDRGKYDSLQGYADDVLEICRELDLERVIFVGHSVSAMIGVLAAIQEPERFDELVLIGPSPRYIDDGDYIGGFSREDIEGLLDSSTATTWAGRAPWRR